MVDTAQQPALVLFFVEVDSISPVCGGGVGDAGGSVHRILNLMDASRQRNSVIGATIRQDVLDCVVVSQTLRSVLVHPAAGQSVLGEHGEAKTLSLSC